VVAARAACGRVGAVAVAAVGVGAAVEEAHCASFARELRLVLLAVRL
jgi:hypothetical protein